MHGLMLTKGLRGCANDQLRRDDHGCHQVPAHDAAQARCGDRVSIKDWADLNDNRLGPILRDLAEAAEGTTDDETLRQLANRLKFMAGAVHSHRYRIRSQSEKLGGDNGG